MKIEWKQITAGLLIGLSIGYFAGVCCPMGRHMFGRTFGRVSPEKKMDWMMKRLSSKLNLNDSQKTQVAAILGDSRKKMLGLHEAEKPKFDEVRNQTNAEIRKVLTPEQQPVFDKLQSEWQARRDKRHHK